MSVGYEDQQPDVLGTLGKLFGHEPKGSAVPVASPGGDIHHTVSIQLIDGSEFRIGVQRNPIVRGMAIDHHRDMERLTEIVQDDGGGPCVGGAAAAAHGPRFIQEQPNGKLRRIVGQAHLGKHPAVIPRQGVDIQAPSHIKAGLPAPPSLILKLSGYAALELL